MKPVNHMAEFIDEWLAMGQEKTIAELQAEVTRLKELLAKVKAEADDIVDGLIQDKGIVSHYGCPCCMPSRDFRNADSVCYSRLQHIVELVSPESYKRWEDEEDRVDHIAYKEFQSSEAGEFAGFDKD
jgi:hypothetical protein